MNKPNRQELIVRLLADHSVSKQQQLVSLLDSHGIRTTRATVSRDLEELSAVKVRVPGGKTVYAILEHPVERIAPEDHLRRVMSDWVAHVASSGNLLVLRTSPGSAHVVASAMDRAGLKEVLGTVAGDDTLLVVVPEDVSSVRLADKLRDLAGQTRPHDTDGDPRHD